jgi:hypothetical protein
LPEVDAALLLPGAPARAATSRLVLEALLGVELLLTYREDELLAALFAFEDLVLEHLLFSS